MLISGIKLLAKDEVVRGVFWIESLEISGSIRLSLDVIIDALGALLFFLPSVCLAMVCMISAPLLWGSRAFGYLSRKRREKKKMVGNLIIIRNNELIFQLWPRIQARYARKRFGLECFFYFGFYGFDSKKNYTDYVFLFIFVY